MEDIEIRRVKKEDLWQVSTILVESWKTAYRGIIDTEYLENLKIEDKYKKRLKDYDKTGFIVAVLKEEIVGLCRYKSENVSVKEDKDIDCELLALYVKPSLKGHGIGQKLMKYVFQDQIRNKKQKMILRCFKENYSSRRFYEKMGGTLYAESEVEVEGKKYPKVSYIYDLEQIQ